MNKQLLDSKIRELQEVVDVKDGETGINIIQSSILPMLYEQYGKISKKDK